MASAKFQLFPSTKFKDKDKDRFVIVWNHIAKKNEFYSYFSYNEKYGVISLRKCSKYFLTCYTCVYTKNDAWHDRITMTPIIKVNTFKLKTRKENLLFIQSLYPTPKVPNYRNWYCITFAKLFKKNMRCITSYLSDKNKWLKKIAFFISNTVVNLPPESQYKLPFYAHQNQISIGHILCLSGKDLHIATHQFIKFNGFEEVVEPTDQTKPFIKEIITRFCYCPDIKKLCVDIETDTLHIL